MNRPGFPGPVTNRVVVEFTDQELVTLLGVASVNDLPHVFSTKFNPKTNKMEMYDAPLSSYVFIFQHQSGEENNPTSGPHMQTAYPKPDKTKKTNYASK